MLKLETRRKHKSWTERENAYLFRTYGKKTTTEIAATLGRTVGSIWARVAALKVAGSPEALPVTSQGGHSRTLVRWSVDDEWTIKTLALNGATVLDMTRAVNRTADACRARISKLGVVRYGLKANSNRSKPIVIKADHLKRREQYALVGVDKQPSYVVVCMRETREEMNQYLATHDMPSEVSHLRLFVEAKTTKVLQVE